MVKTKESPGQQINLETQENCGGLMCTTIGARGILKRKCKLIAQHFILDSIYEDIILTPTNLKPNPTHPDRHLALTMYKLATGCTYFTLSDLFGGSSFAASKFFNKICRLMVSHYDRYVHLLTTDEE